MDERWVEPRTLLALWAGVLLGPIAWALHLNLVYGIATLTCDDSRLGFHLSTIGTLVMAMAGGVIAWRIYQQIGAGEETEGGRRGRSRFMAISGVVLAAAFALVILAQWVPVFIVSPCDPGAGIVR